MLKEFQTRGLLDEIWGFQPGKNLDFVFWAMLPCSFEVITNISGWRAASIIQSYSNPGRNENFLFSTKSRPALGPTQPPIQWEPKSISLGIKRSGHETDFLPPSNVEVKNGGAVPPLPNISSRHSS
jgi:hypothetical protein